MVTLGLWALSYFHLILDTDVYTLRVCAGCVDVIQNVPPIGQNRAPKLVGYWSLRTVWRPTYIRYPVLVTIPLWIPLVVFAAVECFFRYIYKCNRHGRCIECGYDLRGQLEPRCPECGKDFDARLLQVEAS